MLTRFRQGEAFIISIQQVFSRPMASLVLPTLLALTACSASEEEAVVGVNAAEPTEVVVQVLQPETWQGRVETFGVIEALEEINVAAELSGTVSAVHVDEGDRVEAGHLLLELNPQKRGLAADQAAQAVERAEAALKEARLKLSRRQDLARQKSVSREVLDNAQLAVDGAKAAYEEALASHKLAQRELADTRIYSPTAGLVDVQAVAAGEAVQAGATLITLQAVAGLRMHTWVSEADILNIRSGAEAQVAASGIAGRTFQAKVEWVGVNADPATGNFPVKLILTEGMDLLRPGMTARAILEGVAVENSLLLPESALVDRERRRVVFVVEDGVVRMREPALAAGFSNRLHILDGLEAGDQVVVSGHAGLLDGAAVRVAK
jgi:membrane fusion protein, multidrug efflux system